MSQSRTASKALVLATVCAAVLAINLDTTIVNVALPSISDQLDAGTRQLQWIVDGYNLAFAGLVLAAGSVSDRFGRRPALILGLLGFAAASAAGAFVDSAGALVAARVAMGACAALIFPTTLSIISNTFDLEWPPGGGRLTSFPEIDGARWLWLEQADAAILPSQRPLLRALRDRLAHASP